MEGKETMKRDGGKSNPSEQQPLLRFDGHFVARAVLRSYLLRSSVRLRFSLRSTKTRERSKRSRLTSPSNRSSRTSPFHRPISAVVVGIAVGAPLEDIVRGIEEVNSVSGRCELIDEEQAFGVIVDYAHTPDALSRLLDFVKELGPRRIITGTEPHCKGGQQLQQCEG